MNLHLMINLLIGHIWNLTHILGQVEDGVLWVMLSPKPLTMWKLFSFLVAQATKLAILVENLILMLACRTSESLNIL